MHEIESTNIVRYCYTLSTKSLCPSNLEKQNFKLVLQIFNLQCSEGLKVADYIYDLLKYEGTVIFIKLQFRGIL